MRSASSSGHFACKTPLPHSVPTAPFKLIISERTFLTNVPSVTPQGMSFEELLEFTNGDEAPNIPYEAVDLLKRLLEPRPDLRITAEQALQHPFLAE